jgi:hypothetical protein
MPYKSSDAPDYGAGLIRVEVSVQGPSSRDSSLSRAACILEQQRWHYNVTH